MHVDSFSLNGHIEITNIQMPESLKLKSPASKNLVLYTTKLYCKGHSIVIKKILILSYNCEEKKQIRFIRF